MFCWILDTAFRQRPRCQAVCTVAASLVLAMPIVFVFPLQWVTMWKGLGWPALLKGNYAIFTLNGGNVNQQEALFLPLTEIEHVNTKEIHFFHARLNHLFPTIKHLKQFQTFTIIGLRFEENRKGSKLKMPKYLKRPEHQRPISTACFQHTHAHARTLLLLIPFWSLQYEEMVVFTVLKCGFPISCLEEGKKSLWTMTAPWQTLTIWLKNK